MSRYLLLCWRDSEHPQGGGSERYLEHIAKYLADHGHEVVFRTARARGSRRLDMRDGVQFSRGGGRLTVYPRAWLFILRNRMWAALHRRPAFDAVIDTQNGVPFGAAVVAGAPTIVLSHHCHREQWPVAGRGLAQLGWWIESRLSPWLHRRAQWLTVSLPSAAELAELGIDPTHIAVVRNGVDPIPETADLARRAQPARLVVLSRLVPHKQVEDALEVLAAVRRTHPDVELDVIGDGWWAEQLTATATALGISHAVHFHGYVDERRKHELLSAATLHLMPSRKEGWGLAVMEAAQHRVPTIGYRHAAGLQDSIVDAHTGFLVDSPTEMAHRTTRLLDSSDQLEALGAAAERRAAGFSWELTGAAVEWLLGEVRAGRRHSGVIAPPGFTDPALTAGAAADVPPQNRR